VELILQIHRVIHSCARKVNEDALKPKNDRMFESDEDVFRFIKDTLFSIPDAEVCILSSRALQFAVLRDVVDSVKQNLSDYYKQRAIQRTKGVVTLYYYKD
jgi:hypothetical protein